MYENCYNTAGTANVWTSWTNGGNGTSCTTWQTWTLDSSSCSIMFETPETRAFQREMAERERVEGEKRRKADRQAKRLFLSLVGRKEYQKFNRLGYYEVLAHSGRRYRLVPGDRMLEMDGSKGDKIVARLCVVPETWLPPMDVLVQRFLFLRSGEVGERLIVGVAKRSVA